MRYAKTEAGQQAFKTRSPLISARQRSAFILIDGVKTADEVLASTSGLGVTREDLEHLVAQGFIAAPAAAAPVVTEAVSERTPQQRYAEAYPIAVQLTSGLGLRGFTLNLAVEAAADYDGLAALLPRLQQAVGMEACARLEKILFR